MPRPEYDEGARILGICNACRYCEGYCAVFPAMERRLSFPHADLNYLANLCHNCGECLYACQYAPPHEFAVNVPQTLARIRAASYRDYTWPGVLSGAFARNGLLVAFAFVVTLAGFLGGTAWVLGPGLTRAVPGGDFYRILPHEVMADSFGAVFLFAVVAIGIGCRRFWRDGDPTSPGPGLIPGFIDALTLKNLHGGGAGCTYPERARAPWRRRFHHLTFYGFLCCFAATCVGTVYHYLLGWHAPYRYLSLPVVLGTLGGVALLAGLTGLYMLKGSRDPDMIDTAQDGMDTAFIALLWLISLTGLILLAVRETAAMGVVLLIHLAAVMALFLTLPYGRFVHGIYRTAALIKDRTEARRPQ